MVSNLLQSYTPTFEDYKKKVIEGDFKPAIKVEWLNPDESVKFEFTNALYGIEVDLNVNYQSGSRRSCTLTLNNDKNKFPINFNNIWFGQKFKLWMGIYIDDKTPCYFPQGVFYVSNPSETYNPTTRIVTINGVDKWAYLDGTLFGRLSGSYQTNIGVNLYDALRELLKTPSAYSSSGKMTPLNIEEYFTVENSTYYFEGREDSFVSNNRNVAGSTAQSKWTAKSDVSFSFDYNYDHTNGNNFSIIIGDTVVLDNVYGSNRSGSYSGRISKGMSIVFKFKRTNYSMSSSYRGECAILNLSINIEQPIDPIPPLLSSYFSSKSEHLCPYTATVERGQTLADVILEYATILCANVYYDANGRLVLEPMIDTADDITDTNKEILWDYSVDEKTFLGINQTYNFDKVYNDIIVLGNVVNGHQFKGRVQNRNPLSNTCVQRIGLKTKEPFEDNQYVSDEQCIELAKYYAKIDTILQKSGDISSIPLYHLDVNKLVTISTPNNNMSKELYLITGYSLSKGESMTVNVTSVNILKDFGVVEVDTNA